MYAVPRRELSLSMLVGTIQFLNLRNAKRFQSILWGT